MRSLKTSLLSAAAVLLVITASANADRQLIDLGPGVAYSINNNGLIVGSDAIYRMLPGGSTQGYACLFDPPGSRVNIAPIDSGSIIPSRIPSYAFSINNNNKIVGLAGNAYLFDSTGAGGGKELTCSFPPPPLFANPDTTARSINDNGFIVGESSCNYSGSSIYLKYQMKACLFREGYYGTNLGDLGGGYSSAYSINNNNQIVGDAVTSSGAYRACLFDFSGNGANINLGTLAGCDVSEARSINNLNQIVGYAYGDSADISTAVLFDSSGNGANIDLGGLDGGYDKSIAYYINDNSQIVGWAVNGSEGAACLFDPTGQGNNINLNSLIDPASGWKLERAYSINNNGWIVGDMTNASGKTHAFLLTPEPATVLLFAFGGVAILRKRRA